MRGILDNALSLEEISPSGELSRRMEGYHGARGAATRRNHQNPTIQDATSDTDPVRLEQIHRNAEEASSLLFMPPRTRDSPSSMASRLAPYAAARSADRPPRPRMAPSDRYLERQRHVAERELRDTARMNLNLGLELMQDAGRQLEAAGSSLRAHLDAPLPHGSSSQTNELDSGDRDHRRVKRRKVDHDTTDKGFSGFSYGRYGQVEQGKLKMEIVSCDGGTFEGEAPSRGEFEPENVLLDDRSVYCTKSNRCNLVLRHQGSTTFCLTELIIKAPHQHFTAPYVFSPHSKSNANI